jgi:hypothetical protein
LSFAALNSPRVTQATLQSGSVPPCSREKKEAASPPLTFRRAAQATGPLLRPQGCCASRWRATALRAALDPGDLGGPWEQEERAGPEGLPRPGARRASPAVAGGCGTRTPGNKVNWRSINRRRRKITQIQARAQGPVTSSQQSHLAKLRHTEPGVHETRDAPQALLMRTGACLLRATPPPREPGGPTPRSKANQHRQQALQEKTRQVPGRYEHTLNARQNPPSGTSVRRAYSPGTRLDVATGPA